MHWLSLEPFGFLRKPCTTCELLPLSLFGNDCLPFFPSHHISHIAGIACLYSVSMEWLLEYFNDNVPLFVFCVEFYYQDPGLPGFEWHTLIFLVLSFTIFLHVCVCGSSNLWRISSILILLFLSPSSFGSSSCSSCLLFPWPLFYFTCIGDFPACITCVQCPERPEESIPGLELQLGCKSPHGCWKLNLGCLEEQNKWVFSPALLTITFLIWKHFFVLWNPF